MLDEERNFCIFVEECCKIFLEFICLLCFMKYLDLKGLRVKWKVLVVWWNSIVFVKKK